MTAARTAWAFPGVGVRLSATECAFYRQPAIEAHAYLAAAADVAGEDLAALLADPSREPSAAGQELLAHALNCATAALLRRQGLEAACVTGHSLGVYAALVASGALGYEQSLQVVVQARAAVCGCCPPGAYGLLAVVGLPEPELAALLAGATPAAIVNRNSPIAYALAGPPAVLREIGAQATQRGAFKVALLSADLPYHHPSLAGPAAAPFRRGLEPRQWNVPGLPVYSTLDQRLLTTPGELLDYTVRNLVTPVDWCAAVGALREVGVEQVVEAGPGRSLQRAADFIAGAPPHLALAQTLRPGREARR